MTIKLYSRSYLVKFRVMVQDSMTVKMAKSAASTTTDTAMKTTNTLPDIVSFLTNVGFSIQIINADIMAIRINIGKHLTPVMRILPVLENQSENGYGLDGLIWPFYNSIRCVGVNAFHEDKIPNVI